MLQVISAAGSGRNAHAPIHRHVKKIPRLDNRHTPLHLSSQGAGGGCET